VQSSNWNILQGTVCDNTNCWISPRNPILHTSCHTLKMCKTMLQLVKPKGFHLWLGLTKCFLKKQTEIYCFMKYPLNVLYLYIFFFKLVIFAHQSSHQQITKIYLVIFTVRLLKPRPPRQWKPIRWQKWNNRFQHFQIQPMKFHFVCCDACDYSVC